MLTALAAMAAAQTVEPAKDWRAIARSDVAAAYREFAENHPGIGNPEDPAFPKRVAAARDAALKAAAETPGRRGYIRALDIFSEGLADGHANVSAIGDLNDPAAKPVWPGFIAARRGDGMIVHRAGLTSPAPVGSAILSCDAKPITQTMRDRFRGLWFRPAEAGQWWQVGPMLFLGSSPPVPGQPQRCTFRLPDGSVREAQLPWSPLPPGTHELFRRAMAGESTPIGLSEPRPGIHLIGLPTFSPDEAGAQAYRRLYADIDRRRTELPEAKAIVLDLRFNNGGSSEWGHELARRLWGRQAFADRLDHYFRNVRIWWRASRDNVAAMPAREAAIRSRGQIDAADEEHAVGEGMRSALAAGRRYHIETLTRGGRGDANSPTELATPVYVITHGGCASACLDAVDGFKLFPNVKLIGAPTSADTIYMDVRWQPLPSGEGRILIPLKAWLNRPRKSGEVYRPDIAFNNLDWSTSAFLNRIETDLQSSQRAKSAAR